METKDAHNKQHSSKRDDEGELASDARAVMQNIDEKFSVLLDRYDEIYAELSQRAKDHPYALLGMALGVGFVLGGGLRTRAMGALLTVGARTLLSNAATTWLTSNLGDLSPREKTESEAAPRQRVAQARV